MWSILCGNDTDSFFSTFSMSAEERWHPGKARLWDTDAGGSLQAAAGLQQAGADPPRLQEPADLQRQDQGVPHAAGEKERGARHDGSCQEVRNSEIIIFLWRSTYHVSLQNRIIHDFGDKGER